MFRLTCILKNAGMLACVVAALLACGSVPRGPAHLAPSNRHLAPGQNADFQKAATGQVMPALLGLMLWTEKGGPLDHVGIAPRDLVRFPRYTGGLLVQDVNLDGVLDSALDRVVGGIIGAAPSGAKGQSAASPVGADGKPILSGQLRPSPAYSIGSDGEGAIPGLLGVQFRVGDKAGPYRPTFELIGGTSFQFTLEAVSAP